EPARDARGRARERGPPWTGPHSRIPVLRKKEVHVMNRISRTVLALSAAACVSLAGAALAQDAKKDEKKDDKKPAGMEMPKPGAEHKKLGYFVGSWKMAAEMKPGPMGPGGKINGTSNCAWFDGHFAVVCKDSSSGAMGNGKGMGVLAYDMGDGMYEYMGI